MQLIWSRGEKHVKSISYDSTADVYETYNHIGAR